MYDLLHPYSVKLPVAVSSSSSGAAYALCSQLGLQTSHHVQTSFFFFTLTNHHREEALGIRQPGVPRRRCLASLFCGRRSVPVLTPLIMFSRPRSIRRSLIPVESASFLPSSFVHCIFAWRRDSDQSPLRSVRVIRKSH